MSAPGAITTRDLVVDYRTATGMVRALAHPGMTIDGGERVAIMGPSGCGKSTLLGLIAGLALPTTGLVAVGDTIVTSLSEHERVRFRRRSLGLVFQADNLLPHLTAEENVALQLAISRSEAATSGSATAPGRMLERLGIGALAGRLPDELSGGQRQRVAVARALVHGPAVVLADEPTGALDEQSAAAVVELLLGAVSDVGATVVVVTHDPAVAAHADRVEHLAPATMPAAA